MNTKQVKKLRKQLGYKRVSTNTALTEEQVKLKKKYKALKRAYKTPAQLKQEKFETDCAARRVAKENILRFEDKLQQELRAQRKLVRLSKTRGLTDEQKQQSKNRKELHANTQAALEAAERSYRQKLASDKVASKKAADEARKLRVAEVREKTVLNRAKKVANDVESDAKTSTSN